MRNPDISENTSGSTGSGSSGTVGSGNYLLHEMIGSYEVLVRDMSRKFGFSVDHLNADNLRYGPISTDRQANTNLSNVNNTNILSPLRRNSRSSQNNLNTGVATIAQSTVPRVFFKPDYSGSEHATIRSLQRSFQMAGSGRTPLESVTFSLPTNKSNSSFNVLSADPPPLPDRPLLTRPAVQTMNTSGSGGGTRPTTLSTHNTSDNSSGNLLVSGGISNHDDLGTARGRTITPDDDAHTHNINSSINKEKKQLTSPSITSRFESSPSVIRSRTRPLPPLPPTPVGNSTSSNLNNVHVTNSESAPPLPERKSKASCPPAISTGCRSQNDPSSDFP
ncbi:unnamed protein product [Heterobilharzia americana]|nr:unnamed protein product [Heterobilharzia americana]